MNLFSEAEELRAYRGSTLPLFRVDVNGDGVHVYDCTMRMDLANTAQPDEVVLTKECNYYSDDHEGFAVRLTSEDTAELCGMYMAHFVLTDPNGKEHRALVVPVVLLPSPREVT